jgi:hypothetical protein
MTQQTSHGSRRRGQGKDQTREGQKPSGGIEMARALSHPLRVRILTQMNTPIRRMSPIEFSERTGEPLGTTSYHFRVLDRSGCIRVVEEVQRRGATEHVYEPVKRAMAWKREWENLGPAVRQNIAASALRNAVEQIGSAVDSGTFDQREDSHLSHDTIWVDEEGWTELHMMFQRMLEDLLTASHNIEKRLGEDPDLPRFLATYLMATFETPATDPQEDQG